MMLMKHSLLVALLLTLLFSPVGFALVPGPILLSDEQLQSLQGDTSRQLKVPPTRARAACLNLGEVRFCPGMPQAQVQSLLQKLSPQSQKRVLLFMEGPLCKAVLVFLPALIKLPPLRLGDAGVVLGPEPVEIKALTADWPFLPVQQSFEQTFAFRVAWPKDFKSDAMHVWYYGELHLGLLTRRTAQGEFVTGAFVVK